MIRPKSKERVLRAGVLIAGDLLIAWGAVVASTELRRQFRPDDFVVDAAIVALFSLSLVTALALSGFYQTRVTPRTRPSYVTALVMQAALAAIAGTVIVRTLPRMIFFAVPLFELLALPLWRAFLGFVAPVRPRDAILAGVRSDVELAISGLDVDRDRRIRVIASIGLGQLLDPAVRETLRAVEEVILVSPDADPRLRLEFLRIRGARGFLMMASHVDALLASRTHGWIGDQPLVEVAASCGFGISAAIKRAMDVVGASLLMLITAPAWILTWIAIRLDDGAPVLVRQQRMGRGGVPFGMWKFRSMRGAVESADDTSPSSRRITRTGALLRRYHVDELPQLINVLTGDMSLVGPRPERPELVAKILAEVPDFDLRTLVRPGIAGLAQVSAEYDTRPEVKLRYDLIYMCDWSVWADLKLMLRAVSSSLAGTGR